MATLETPWGPNGEAVYRRTYSRLITDGELAGGFETWPDTVQRVARGNLAFVYGDPSTWSDDTIREYNRLTYYMNRLAILPAGRHLWATGVPGRQYLFNCHVSGWGQKFSEHFAFTFMRLVEGGGVGANYSSRLVEKFGPPKRAIDLVLTADESHPDYEKMREYLLPSTEFDARVAQEAHSKYRGDGVVEDTREGWASALSELIDTSMSVYGLPDRPRTVYFDLSKIRREGAPLVSSGGVAAGPAPLARMLSEVAAFLNDAFHDGRFSSVRLMEIDHAIAVGAVAGGKRRSARMSVCHWADPDIMAFIAAKQDGSKHWSTNISVEIDDRFLECLAAPNLAGKNHAEQVHEAVTTAMLANGEPGYWNSDLAKVGETGEIVATNPCGEIALEAWEACNLGNVNMAYFAGPAGVDFEGLQEVHRLITRFLIRATYADINDPEQRRIQDRNRRIGVGHHGVQDFWAKQGVRYSDIPVAHPGGPYSGAFSSRQILRHLYRTVRETARDYAFELRIPEPVKVTSIAPGGTTPKLAGIAEGIGAVYARWFEQRIRFSLRDEREFEQVSDYISQGFAVEDDVYDPSGMTSVVVIPTENNLVAEVRELGYDTDVVQSADQLSVRQMLEVQAFYQELWADNSISYTCNIPEGSLTPEELADTLREYLPRLKGTTIMVDASREQMPYTRISEADYMAAEARRVGDSTSETCQSGACPVR